MYTNFLENLLLVKDLWRVTFFKFFYFFKLYKMDPWTSFLIRYFRFHKFSIPVSTFKKYCDFLRFSVTTTFAICAITSRMFKIMALSFDNRRSSTRPFPIWGVALAGFPARSSQPHIRTVTILLLKTWTRSLGVSRILSNCFSSLCFWRGRP